MHAELKEKASNLANTQAESSSKKDKSVKVKKLKKKLAKAEAKVKKLKKKKKKQSDTQAKFRQDANGLTFPHDERVPYRVGVLSMLPIDRVYGKVRPHATPS
eukprot:TRINITY_DN10987_c0_g1_i1.p1 TRINITY_DN10987_c0_g1~~TRINITY_DN10987_c0_g1_i1.p1  ORF type:complete len:117 (+),score=12.45 TRINITY_DN10987_c0_g1_i1:48-353(+)